jgi:hypothetical protein
LAYPNQLLGRVAFKIDMSDKCQNCSKLNGRTWPNANPMEWIKRLERVLYFVDIASSVCSLWLAMRRVERTTE